MTTIPKIPLRTAADPRTDYSTSELKALDAAMRVIALEQVADERVGAWPRSSIGLMAATKHFLDQGVRLHKDWITDRPSGIANSIVAKSIAMLGGPDGKELAGDVMGGLSLKSHPRGEAGSAAQAVKREILSGRGTDHWKANILNHVNQRAISRLKRRGVRLKTHGPGSGSVSVSPKGEEGEVHEVSTFDLITKDPEVLSADPMIKRWINDKIDDMPVRAGSEYYYDVVRAWVADPYRRGLKTELAEQYGVGINSIKKPIAKFMAFIKAELKRDRKMRRHFDLLLLRGEHGRRAGGSAALVKLAAAYVNYLDKAAGQEPSSGRVAARYLRS